MKITANCDGGSRGNPGPAAIGIVLRDEDKVLEAFKQQIGEATNNEAEYRALIASLEMARKFTKDKVEIIMDSELVVKQMNGEYAVKSESLLPLFKKVKVLEKEFEKVTYTNVYRSDYHQAMADRLVNEALDMAIHQPVLGKKSFRKTKQPRV